MTPSRGFSDKDLKRLKADMKDYPELLQFKIDALLARLEAAEAVLECHVWGYCGKCKVDHEEAWRKAKGDLK